MPFIPKRKRANRLPRVLPLARINAMIEEATVDAFDSSEQASGFFTMIEAHLACPFPATVLGLPVTVARIELHPGDQIVALCSNGSHRQAIPLLDLPLLLPPPVGAEWIEAYRHWLKTTG